MCQHKGLTILGSILLLFCTLAFAGASSPLAFAASTKASVPRAIANSVESCPPEIGIGNEGYWVKVVQNELNAPGTPNSPYHVFPLKVDGIFGQLTAEGVEDFQIFTHIQVDGIVGPQTWHELGWC